MLWLSLVFKNVNIADMDKRGHVFVHFYGAINMKCIYSCPRYQTISNSWAVSGITAGRAPESLSFDDLTELPVAGLKYQLFVSFFII